MQTGESTVTTGEAQVQTLPGLESSFVLPGPYTPPRWKSLIVLCLAIYPISNLPGLLARPLFPNASPWLSTLILLPLTLAIVSYLILPWLTRLLARWL